MAFHGVVCCLHCGMLDSSPTHHKRNCLMSYQHACNTRSREFDCTLKCFFHTHRQLFSVLKNNNFSGLTCYRNVCRYIKKVCIVDNAINTPKRAFGTHFMASQLSRWAKMTKLVAVTHKKTIKQNF